MSSKDVVEDFCSSLCDLTVNSKPHINMLTMLAEDYIDHAPAIVKAVEDQLKHVSGDVKLPVLYLIDSIIKNVGESYIPLFCHNIVATFSQAFERVDENARSQMYKLRQTWTGIFPAGKLFALDTTVNGIDPAWPITAATSSIHLNPKFLNNPPSAALPLTISTGKNQQELLKQKKELLELQKRKVELELLQTKAILEEQTKWTGGPLASRDVTKIPPATNIITKPKNPVDALKAKPNSVAAVAAPVRIRDPRLRMKEAAKETPVTALKSPPRPVLSTVPSPANKAIPENVVRSPKKDKKMKKNKEEREKLKNKTDSRRRSPSKLKESKVDKNKMTRAEEVLRNLEEEQRLSKIQKLGSDIVINKAKQHEQKLHPKIKENPGKDPVPKLNVSSQPAEPKVNNQPPIEVTSESAQAVAPKSPSPLQTVSSSPVEPMKLPEQKDQSNGSNNLPQESPKPQPEVVAPVLPPQTPQYQPTALAAVAETAPRSDVKTNDKILVNNEHQSKTPSPPRIVKNKAKHGPKRKRESSPVGSPKQKSPPNSDGGVSVIVSAPLLPDPEAILGSGQDIDFRLLTSKSIEVENSPVKKARNDSLDELFGKEDVDLRAIPPPAPIISRLTPPCSPTPRHSPERQKSWANLKRSNSEVSSNSSKRPKLPHDRRKSDRFGLNKDKEVVDEEIGFDDPAYEERAKERVEMIMKHAEEQVSNGNITFAQYNSLLKEVITMNEKRKLEEAMRRDQNAQDEPELEEQAPDDPPPPQEPPNVFNKRRKFVNDLGSPISEDGTFDDAPPAPPPPDINDRDYKPREARQKDDRERRYRDRDRPSRFEPSRNLPSNAGPWPVGQPSSGAQRGRARDKYGRWGPASGSGRSFDANKPNYRFRPPVVNNFSGGIPPNREVPAADPAVLELIAKDTMKTINIDGVPREIRFYGETAIIMMAWDDPRELSFQPGQRRVTFNDRETVLLQFNTPYREVYVDGVPCKVRLGAPTREIFIDGMFYESIFGGPPLQVRAGNRLHSVRISAPLPNVRIGNESRKDLVAGKVTLIVDANDIFPVYLDAKPQRFDIGGVPYILRFVEALQTVVINGVPFKIEFGSNLPVPMFFHGEKHYLRFSALPKGVKPGYVTIINMEGGRLPSPPPPILPPPPIMGLSDQPGLLPPAHSHSDVILSSEPIPRPVDSVQQQLDHVIPRPQSEQQPLELLATLMPTVFTPGIGQSYTVEENSNHPLETSTVPTSVAATSTAESSINVGELLKKLVAVGIVPATEKKEEKREEVSTEIVPVSFDRPESLKTRQPGLVHALYSGMQCSSCGVRFPPEQTGKYSQHLDWHFRQNRRERDAMRIAQSRRWNYDVSDWIQFQEIEEKEDRAQSWFEIQEKRNFETEETVDDEPSVPTGEKGENACCEICHDRFDQFYNEDKEEWHLRRAIEVNEKLYHPLCHQEREEKLSNSVIITEPTELDKSVLLVPTEEPETIEIPDDVVVGEEAVLGMPVDDPDKVETIDLDSEQSSSKDGLGEEEVKKDEEAPHESDDDDILQIEVLENKIETFELSDEEDMNEDEEPKEAESPKSVTALVGEDYSSGPFSVDSIVEVDLSKVKTEKLEVVDLDAQQTSQPLVVSSIDGNVELEDAAPVSLPKRIKINISSAITKPSKTPVIEPSIESPEDEEPPEIDSSAVINCSEPLPPGEELYPLSVKPKLSNVDLKVLPPVNKGSELSALCSIM